MHGGFRGATATIVSFRLGGGDGVSIEAEKWTRALEELGFGVCTVAGSGEAEVLLPGLSIDAEEPPPKRAVVEALAGADLVVVENLCSLPLNAEAGRLVAEVVRGRRAILHHHDLPWQRERFLGAPPPPDDPSWAHVTINQISRLQLARRGIRAFVVRNAFDSDVPQVQREACRRAVGVRPDELVLLQPTRALPRKNIGAAIALAETLGATFWLLGPAEDGFGPELDRILQRARCRVLLGHSGSARPTTGTTAGPMNEAYGACDVVVLASTWEGFGNPAVESAVHERPLAIGHYPVAAELAGFGFRWFAVDDPGSVADWLENPDQTLLEHNHSVARRYFSTEQLPGRLASLFETLGWVEW